VSHAEFGPLVRRVADEHCARGALDPAFLDAVGVVLGTSGLHALVDALHASGDLPGVLTGLGGALPLPDAPRRVALAVSVLADPSRSRDAAVQLERARRHLGLLARHAETRPLDLRAEVEQLVTDLVAGRELP
jgi:hypothetical protein